MLRWCRIVANQPTLWTTVSGLQAATSSSDAISAARLPTSHLLGARTAQHRFDAAGLVRARWDEHPELVVCESRVVLNRAEPARGECGVEQNAEDRGERAEENRHLEHDHDVGRHGPHRFAAAHERPARGGDTTPFPWLTDPAGKFFTNKRNHMKNQPKLPAMMPQSAHVGL